MAGEWNSLLERMIVAENIRHCFRPTLKPSEVFRREHQIALSIFEHSNACPTEMENTIWRPIFTSKRALNKLERTDISQLCLERSAIGKYVLVRCIEKGLEVWEWHTVVEDHVGNVCTAIFCNYPLQELFSPGTVLIIKEPFFKFTYNGLYCIRCNYMTDIMALRPSHPLFHLAKSVKWVNELRGEAVDPLPVCPIPSSSLKWKERGNFYFDQNQLILAREAYFLGLELCKREKNSVNDEKILKLNILVIHLELGYFEKAIELGNEILDKFPDEKKALFRLGKAYYCVRKFEEAFQTYERFCQKFPKEKEGIKELERVQERLKERNGEFDVEKLQRMAKQKPLKEIDCADYEGPIEIKEIPGKGRGLVLTKDVKKDTVVMVSKALASVLNPAPSSRRRNCEDSSEVRDRDFAEIVLKIAHMISKNPCSFGPPVLQLTSAPKWSAEPPLLQLFCDPELKQEPICHIETIKAICKQNVFRIWNARNGGGKGTGLFILPSFMNRSCAFNVIRKFFNDVMVCTAAADLKAGTELTTRFIVGDRQSSPEDDYSSLQIGEERV